MEGLPGGLCLESESPSVGIRSNKRGLTALQAKEKEEKLMQLQLFWFLKTCH